MISAQCLPSVESGPKGQAGLLGGTYFRRDHAAQEGPVFSSDQGPRLASDCEAQVIKFLCLFEQKLGDIEGQVPCTVLLNSLGAWLSLFTGLTSYSSHSIQIRLLFLLRLLSDHLSSFFSFIAWPFLQGFPLSMRESVAFFQSV